MGPIKTLEDPIGLIRDAVKAKLNAKKVEIFSRHSMNYQRSPNCHNFLTLTLFSYHSLVTPLGAFPAETIGEAVLLFLFKIAVPAKVSKTCKHHQPLGEDFGLLGSILDKMLHYFVAFYKLRQAIFTVHT